MGKKLGIILNVLNIWDINEMVDVAQLVRAPVCGTGGRGFESHLPPQFLKIDYILGCSQAVRHQTLTLACASSNLASPAK